MSFVEVPQQIPLSTLFIFLLAAAISFLTSLANRLLTNPEKAKASRKEISEWNSELRKAQKSGDKKTVEKLMKKQQYILRLQSKMFTQSLKVTLLFIVPLLLMWQVLGGVYIGKTLAYFPGVGPVITFPFYMPSLYWWYLLCSFLFGTVFSRAFGLTGTE